ncbi:MAG: ATP synthase F1 subunit epsilon [Myxococcota bacterium]
MATPMLQVDIVTPEASAFSGEASEVILPAWEGQLGVYPGHDSLLSLIRAGRCVVTTSQGVHRYVVGRGFAEIGPDHVTILTDRFEKLEAVDKAKAQKELDEAEKELLECDASSERWNQAQIALEHARARLAGD